MNIIDLILIAILALGFLSGFQKGFLTSVLATFALAGAWCIAKTLYPELAQTFISSQFSSWLKVNVTFDSLLKNLSVNANELVGAAGQSITALTQSLKDASLPASVISAFSNGFTAAQTSGLTVGKYLTEIVWNGVFNVLSFVLIFSFAYALLTLVVNLIHDMFNLPKLKGIDGILGGILGAARSYIFICLIIAAAPVLFTALDSTILVKLFDGSAVGAFFLNSNNFLSDVFGISGSIKAIVSAKI